MSSIDSKICEFVAEQRELLELELQADKPPANKRTKEESASVTVLGNLHASDTSIGLYGRTVLQLAVWSTVTQSAEHRIGNKEKGGELLLPAHRFTVGDEVEIRPKQSNKASNSSGVVSAVSEIFLLVALFGSFDETLLVPPLSLLPKSSVEVHQKLIHALSTLEKEGTNHPLAGHVVQAMFEESSLHDEGKNKMTTSSSPFEPFNPNLDTSQWEAISFCLQDEQKISLIHGPPGTGKTTTVAELIKQAVHNHHMKVLVTAPSNVAVDTILQRLVTPAPSLPSKNKKKKPRGSRPSNGTNLRVVRLGHPARIQSSILRYSLEALVQNADGTEIVDDVRKELKSFLNILGNPKARSNDKRVAYREMKNLRKEVRTREEKVVQELIGSSQVVFSTNVGAANKILREIDFDLVVIDEAAQALEASCWIPLLRGKKIVLAGDHCQLPPTIKSHTAAQKLGKTMFERLLMDLYAPCPQMISRMLKVQYRMNANIADWASQSMYEGALSTHSTVADQTLSQLLIREDNLLENTNNAIEDDDIKELRETVLLFIDSAGCAMYEGTTEGSGSRYNEGEADVLCHHVQKLLDLAGLKQSQLAIITPYNGQVELLRNQLLPNYPQLEIRSVDGFQGGERDAVILSLVRSSPSGRGGIGFLKDDRRLNVAITRAKRHLCVIGDSETISQSSFISSLVDWIEEHGESRSAMEYMNSEERNHTTQQADNECFSVLLNQLSIDKVSSQSSELKTTEAIKSPKMENNHYENISRRQQDLIDKISSFVQEKKDNIGASEELALSSELTSLDRKFVHEYAERIGIHHRSEGLEGQNRRLILAIPSESPVPLTRQREGHEGIAHRTGDNEEINGEDLLKDNDELIIGSTDAQTLPSNSNSVFTKMLEIDNESGDDDSDNDDGDNADLSDKTQQPRSSSHPSNPLLAELARERTTRQMEAKVISNTPHTPKQRYQKGRKLGGARKAKNTPSNTKNKDEDLLDDMAFLDTQIERVQNAHGRKIVASGSNYRTIVNGVLNNRSKPKERPTNQAASASLRTKLKDAQKSRKSQAKKKKKK